MDRERWTAIQRVFHDVADLPEDERMASIERACGGDRELQAAVWELLEQDTRGDSILDREVDAVAYRLLGHQPPSSVGGEYGPYHIIRRLGAGGMGVVYLGERTDLGQRVAIKVLHETWVSPAGRVRFAAEPRALARLNHPSIAALHSADTLPDGTPWFAMEFVEGVSLTRFCTENRSRLADRLRIFRDVCEAVQHAHQRLIVHRDLKPSNVLVAADGSVKLLDFGIAKQLETFDAPAQTTLCRMVTPNYAAPEQLADGDAGIPSDIYSLGVILYELLAGKLPFDLTNLTLRQAEAIVAERQPAPPSSAAEGTPLAALANAAAWGDLDVLCLTAMHKDPARRYQSVEALIRDIDHFQRGEPLEARPDSARYRAGKFVRRNAGRLGAAAAIIITVATLVVFYTVRLHRANTIALEQMARTERIQHVMFSLFDAGETDVAPSADLRVLTLVDRGVQEARSLDREPDIQVALYQTLGGLYRRLGNYKEADALLTLALDERRRQTGSEDRDSIDTLVELGLLRVDQARLDDAERVEREGVALSTRTHNDRLRARALGALGKVLEERGDYAHAIPMLQTAVNLYSAFNPPPPEYGTTVGELADAQFYAGALDVSATLSQRAIDIDQRLNGSRHPSVADRLLTLGAIASVRERYEEAIEDYRKALDIMRTWYGDDHPETASAMTILAQGLVYHKEYDEAAALLTRSLDIQTHTYGPVSRHVSFVLNERGLLEEKRNNLDAAEADLTRALEINRTVFQGKHFRVANSLENLGGLYILRGQDNRGEALLREAIDLFAVTLGPDHANTAHARIKLGHLLVQEHRYAEAETPLLEGYAALKRESKPPPGQLKSAMEDLVAVYDAVGKPERSQSFRDELGSSGH
jgi:serine/threonine-protein kinase